MSDIEEWRVIPEFPDYKASSSGQIKRFQTDAREHKLTGRPLKQSLTQSGWYLQVTLMRDCKPFSTRVNRAVCSAFHGIAPGPGWHAAHNDGDSFNNAASNLRWALPTGNEFDKKIHGTAAIGDKHWSKTNPEIRPKGSLHGRAKLHESDIPLIRADTRKQRDIASDFGVSQRVIWMIKNCITWNHVS